MAGFKMISIMLLVVLVTLAGVSPVFAPIEPVVILDPPAACPGGVVGVSLGVIINSVGAPFDGGIVLSSDPGGLIGEYDCRAVGASQVQQFPTLCVFHVSESASCGHYTVTVAFPITESGPIGSAPSVSGPFDVAGPCCAVGGCVQPVNTFAMLSPWLAVIGLVGCIGTVAVVAKKRRQ